MRLTEISATQLAHIELLVASVLVVLWCLGKLTHGWWKLRQHRKRQEFLRDSPAALRTRNSDLTAALGEAERNLANLQRDNENLQVQNREQRVEIRQLGKMIAEQDREIQRLTGRCVMMAKELRYEPEAKTINLGHGNAPGRWARKITALNWRNHL